MKKKTFLFIAFFFLLIIGFILVPAVTVAAQQPTPSDDAVNAIAKQLYCPVCENTPLDVCPTQACAQWRDLIRQMLAEGKSEEYIKQYFMDNYGGRVLSEPPRTGLNWLVYILPPVAFLAGVYILFRAFRSWRTLEKKTTARIESSSTSPGSHEYIAHLEEELRKRE